MNHTRKRRPTIAKEWQLAVLKKLQSESSNPTEGQRSAAAAETGLDEKWVKNWFTRQRSKVAARSKKGQPATTEPRQPRDHSTTVPTFRLQLCHVPSGQQGRRSASTPIDPGPNSHQPSLATLESRSSHPSRSTTANAQAIPRSPRSVCVPTYLNNSFQNSTLTPATMISSYSRDPLCNRYPDFSQFFRPQVHERFRSPELLAPVSNHNHLFQLPVDPNLDSHPPTYFQAFFNLLDPLHPGGLPTYQSSSTNLRTCTVAFSMRLVDLLGYP